MVVWLPIKVLSGTPFRFIVLLCCTAAPLERVLGTCYGATCGFFSSYSCIIFIFFTGYTESTSKEFVAICSFSSKADMNQKQRRPECPIETAVSVDANSGKTNPLIWAIIWSSKAISSEVTWHMTFKYQLCQTGYNIRCCCHLVHNLICIL